MRGRQATDRGGGLPGSATLFGAEEAGGGAVGTDGDAGGLGAFGAMAGVGAAVGGHIDASVDVAAFEVDGEEGAGGRRGSRRVWGRWIGGRGGTWRGGGGEVEDVVGGGGRGIGGIIGCIGHRSVIGFAYIFEYKLMASSPLSLDRQDADPRGVRRFI